MSSFEKEPKGILIESPVNPPNAAIDRGKEHAGVRADVTYDAKISDGRNNEWLITVTSGEFTDLLRMVRGAAAECIKIVRLVFDEQPDPKSPVSSEEEEK